MTILDEDSINQLITRTDYHFNEKNYYNLAYPELKKLFLYATFLDENKQYIQDIADVSKESVLYSRYYWWYMFKQKNEQLIGTDNSFDQKLDDILYEMDLSFADGDGVDFGLLQKIEETVNNEIYDLKE